MFIVFILLLIGSLHSYPLRFPLPDAQVEEVKSGYMPSKIEPSVPVNVSSTTASVVVSSTTASWRMIIMEQHSNSYDMWITTFSVNPTTVLTAPRYILTPDTPLTIRTNSALYGIMEAGATQTDVYILKME